MSEWYVLHCNRCDYKFTASFGIGLDFPFVYKETRRAAKEGKFGEELQKFLTENLEGAIDVSKAISMCKKCGRLENIQIFGMYLPEEGFSLNKTIGNLLIPEPFTDYGYICARNAEVKYKLVAKYPHKCNRCGGEVKIFLEMPFKYFECPYCHRTMNLKEFIED